MLGDNDPGCRAAMVWDEERWNTELLSGIRDWTQRRAGSVALRRGEQDVVAIGADAVAVVRPSPAETVAVVVNRGADSVTWPGWHEPVHIEPGGTVVLVKGSEA